MSKSIHEWLLTIEDETARNKAIANANEAFGRCDDVFDNDAQHALLGAFLWCASPEGDTYWREIYNSLGNEKL